MKTLHSFLFIVFFTIASISATTPTFNHVLGFDATNTLSYVDCTAQAAFTPSNFTVELWANITGTVGGATLISNGASPAAGQNQGYTLKINTTSKRLEATVGIGTWLTCSGTGTPLTYGEWSHIAMVSDGIDLKIYLNGVLNSTTTLTAPIITSTKNLYLGEHPSFAGRRVSGQMSDVRIWNIARTQTEISSTMNNSLAGDEEGLVANWKLDQTDGTEVIELTGNYPATRNAGTTWRTNPTTEVENIIVKSADVCPSVLKSGEMLNVKSETNAKILIFSAEGKLVINTLTHGSDNLRQIETGNLNPGLYILNILSNDKHQVTRFMIL